jgi:leucine dehydrogenase
VDIFKTLSDHRYGQLHFAHDERSGLKAIIAIHNLKLGPSLGGVRFIRYTSTDAAVIDALRLARGMSYKAALAGVAHGGGKAVILHPGTLDPDARAEILRAFGRFVNSLNGQYITTEDSGTSPSDIDIVSQETRYVLGSSQERGGSGDPSPFTARGVRRGIEACAQSVLQRTDLHGLHVAIQGVGHVGYPLARELHARGVRLTVCDVVDENTRRAASEFGAAVVSPDAIYDVACDVFSPCALGAILNDDTIPRLRCRVVAGAANNQLAEDRHGFALMSRAIAYAPDYAINAGGLINVAQEYKGYNEATATHQVDLIHDTIAEILQRAQAMSLPPHRVADVMAEEKLF